MSEWTSVSLGELVSIAVGGLWGVDAPTEKENTPVRVIRGIDAHNLAQREQVELPLRWVSPKTLASRVLQPGDVVLEASGSRCGRSYVVRTSDIERSSTAISFSNFSRRLVPNQRVNSDYLGYRLMHSYQIGEITAYVTGTAMPNLDVHSVLSGIRISLPPLLEQQKIAYILGALDDKIERNRRMNVTLEAMTRALFQSWFVDFDPVRTKAEGRQPIGTDTETAALFPDSFEDSVLGPIPKGWTIKLLGDIAFVVDCLHAKKPERVASGRVYLQLDSIREDGLIDATDPFLISEEDYIHWTSRIEVRQGDCVITNVGRVGAVAQIPLGLTAAMGRNMTGIRPKETFNYPTFLLEYLKSDAMRSEILLKTDSGTILDALNVKNIPLLRLIVADASIIRSYEEQARYLRQRMEQNLAELSKLNFLRDTLLPKLLSGELAVGEVAT